VGHRTAGFYLSLFAGALIAGLSIFGFAGLSGRPAIPWASLARSTGVPDRSLPGAWDNDGLTPAGEAVLRAAVVRADGFEIRDRDYDFKFIAAHHRIGDLIEFVVVRDGGSTAVSEPLASFYGRNVSFVIFLLTGALGFLIGFAVFVLRPEDRRARLFFWLCMAFSSAVMINGEWYGVQGRPFHLIPGVLFLFAYTLTPVILLRFCLTFTARKRFPGGPLLWAVSLLFGGFFNGAFVAALLRPSIELFRLRMYFRYFRIFFAVLCIAAIAVLFRAFRAASSPDKRAQIRWVLYGLIIGLGPFMLLYSLPVALGLRPPLDEEAASAFFAVLPPALAFAILRYRLLDITVILNRSVVYSLLTMVTVGVYLLSIEGLRAIFFAAPRQVLGWIPVGAAFIAAMAFAPARSRIQILVDRAFFRRSYDYRRAVLGFATAAVESPGAPDLLVLFSRTLDEALPVTKVGAFVPAPRPDGPGLALKSGLDDAALAALAAAAPGAGEPLAPDELRRLGYDAALPLPLGDDGPSGWVFVGPKRSKLPFTDEDRELLRTLAAEAAATLRRIRLQEEVIYERASREKSEELGRLKTEFISSVSHELRTPMTSLQAISELLKSGKVADAARRGQLLELMAGECGRLGRYLHNVLDFGRIEQDAKCYEMREVDLGPVVAGVVDVVRSAMGGEDLALEAALPAAPVVVAADPDAVRQALFNLVDNAVKYSAAPKRVAVRLAATAEGAEIGVGDNGIGIAPADRSRVFEAFYRAPEAVRHDTKGVGLGLRIVKHIMDAHGGAIDIAGGPGGGTTVTLKFPKRRSA
jgi:signal transduction histidine kinase